MTVCVCQAGELALLHGATACTDVTGFGLLGHLQEMCKASSADANMGKGFEVGAVLHLDKVPLLDGAEEVVRNNIFSSLQVGL